MNRVAPLIMFGFALIGAGAVWSLYNDSLPYFNSFIINDKFYELIALGWKVMPVILVVIGILSLILAGMTASKSQYGVLE